MAVEKWVNIIIRLIQIPFCSCKVELEKNIFLQCQHTKYKFKQFTLFFLWIYSKGKYFSSNWLQNISLYS